jgi:hypothetical protein
MGHNVSTGSVYMPRRRDRCKKYHANERYQDSLHVIAPKTEERKACGRSFRCPGIPSIPPDSSPRWSLIASDPCAQPEEQRQPTGGWETDRCRNPGVRPAVQWIQFLQPRNVPIQGVPHAVSVVGAPAKTTYQNTGNGLWIPATMSDKAPLSDMLVRWRDRFMPRRRGPLAA